MTNQSKKPTFRKILTISTLFVLLAIALSAVVVSFSLPASITIDSAIYEVNDQGDLTIQLTGTKTGVSVANANFSLQVPDTFEMETLTNGTPVIEMLSNGTALEVAEDGSSFRAIFALRTLNSTLLPMQYSLEMYSGTLHYSRDITPQWEPTPEEQSGGGGASVAYYDDPYITSFYAYDSYKGNTEHVKTYVYNPSDYDWYNIQGMRYQIDSSTYTDFYDWTPTYGESSGWIQAHRTYVVHDYLNPVYTSYNGNSRYALNRGTFKVTQVYAYGSRLGGGSWSDSYNPSVSQGEFVVSVPSGTHPVFVLHLVDQNFRNGHDENSWFNDLEEHYFQMYDSWFGRYTDLLDEFGINLESLVLSWSPGTADLYELFNNKIRQDAGSLIGKSGSWTNIQGTHSSNHGFDMLFGHVYLQNTYSGSEDWAKGAGAAIRGSNFAVLMKATVAGWNINQRLGTMHEMLHTYYCDHVSAIWYIMNKSWSAWVMHWDTESTLDYSLSTLHQYDGA